MNLLITPFELVYKRCYCLGIYKAIGFSITIVVIKPLYPLHQDCLSLLPIEDEKCPISRFMLSSLLICMHEDTHTRIYTHINHAQMHVHIMQEQMHTHTHMQKRLHMSSHAHICINIPKNIHMRTHACIYTHTKSFRCMHIHTKNHRYVLTCMHMCIHKKIWEHTMHAYAHMHATHVQN